MPLGERLLLALSRPPATTPAAAPQPHWTVENALHVLEQVCPGFLQGVRGRTVLDFGCGAGLQCVALARAGAARVVGIENNPGTLARAAALVQREGVQDRVALRPALAPEDLGAIDAVISQNSMEHFGQPLAVLRQMASALAPGGRIYLTFGPPWYAPYGAHMRFFTPLPWVNLFFSEQTVLSVRARFRGDGARRYEDVESGLNRMSVARFERLLGEAGLAFEYRRYRPVKGLAPLAHVPLLRELFIAEVNAVLVRSTAR